MRPKQSEKRTEPYLVRRVEELGGQCIKHGQNGWPDRIVLMPGGRIAWAETKSQGDKPRPTQRIRHRQLAQLGQKAYVCDTREKVDELINELTAK